MQLIDKKLFIVLVILLALTLLSWFLNTFYLAEGTGLGITLLVLAFIKVRLVMIHYMEVNEVILPIRIAFESWLLVAAGGTIAIYIL